MGTSYYLVCEEHEDCTNFYDVQNLGVVFHRDIIEEFIEQHSTCADLYVKPFDELPENIAA